MFDCKKNVLSLGRNHKNSRRGKTLDAGILFISFVSEGDNIDFIGVWIWLKWFACFVYAEYCNP